MMLEENVRLEMERNHERYVFLRWGQQAFSRFSVVPPGTGILPPGKPRIPWPGSVDPNSKTASGWLFPTHLSAPTRTQR